MYLIWRRSCVHSLISGRTLRPRASDSWARYGFCTLNNLQRDLAHKVTALTAAFRREHRFDLLEPANALFVALSWHKLCDCLPLLFGLERARLELQYGRFQRTLLVCAPLVPPLFLLLLLLGLLLLRVLSLRLSLLLLHFLGLHFLKLRGRVPFSSNLAVNSDAGAAGLLASAASGAVTLGGLLARPFKLQLFVRGHAGGTGGEVVFELPALTLALGVGPRPHVTCNLLPALLSASRELEESLVQLVHLIPTPLSILFLLGHRRHHRRGGGGRGCGRSNRRAIPPLLSLARYFARRFA
mmetsp:Transcript_62391/g.146606  ORF Transcript_62391/g.146606 Transcript_62391/m.146606 type:complete len:298 (-) Transcript_62391:759-1652(-)